MNDVDIGVLWYNDSENIILKTLSAIFLLIAAVWKLEEFETSVSEVR